MNKKPHYDSTKNERNKKNSRLASTKSEGALASERLRVAGLTL